MTPMDALHLERIPPPLAEATHCVHYRPSGRANAGGQDNMYRTTLGALQQIVLIGSGATFLHFSWQVGGEHVKEAHTQDQPEKKNKPTLLIAPPFSE